MAAGGGRSFLRVPMIKKRLKWNEVGLITTGFNLKSRQWDGSLMLVEVRGRN